ncbi:hypothetical protein [Paraburkholderia sp. J69-2]|nr:hypothetical protein [Paraburkholderia sp. J69-2]
MAICVSGLLSLQGCASTLGNVVLGAGIGAVGVVGALVCALECGGK